MTPSPLVISFYTEDSIYQLEVLALMNSCRELGIELEVEALPCLGSWVRNCARKPQFIRDKLMIKKRPVFWVDADAVFRKAPDFSVMMQSDFAARKRQEWCLHRWSTYLAGSLFINYTPGGLRFADAWVALCQKKIDTGMDLQFLDQSSIFDLMQQGVEANFYALPPSYCAIFDEGMDETERADIVIEHFQASRHLGY